MDPGVAQAGPQARLMAGDDRHAQVLLQNLNQLHGGQAHAAQEKHLRALRLQLLGLAVQEVFAGMGELAGPVEADAGDGGGLQAVVLQKLFLRLISSG